MQRYSPKREAILRALRSTTCHPTAEWVWQRVRPEYPELSLGTVYRNLTAFRQEGIIISVANVAGQEHFDGDTSPHAHLVCEHCGRVLDMPMPVQTGILAPQGSLIRCSEVLFRGLCPACNETESRQASEIEKTCLTGTDY